LLYIVIIIRYYYW